ncbi:hypothetical protein ERJ75_000427400 [Trypanosoma vivax]|uniref:Transmembrane protein n=1 Tax=Trypanosoma vivax (strain Y486) TaxID=1055687 RepID=G0U1Q0_TRYVY|nr:hypothetical protein TRVL_03594 [Trypanosoma vivax]KAH8616985.1 hypothetical protein ERJ75_000427400 [Trypanosoma vivax]CCC50007.1 conserved hypothetical protein [Trypanosoma vivax Y486]
MAAAKQDTPTREAAELPFLGLNRPKGSGESYSSAGGGEVYFNPIDIFGYFWNYVRDEGARKNSFGLAISGPDLHTRPPRWLEDKNVAIDGTPLTDDERQTRNFWQAKYKRELDIGEAIQEVKQTRRMEESHDIIGSIAWMGRKLGLAEPLSEENARRKVEDRFRRLELERDADDTAGEDKNMKGRRSIGLGTPWKVLMESLETGKPVVRVANEYRPCVDYYGLDSFLDSRLSLIWFTTKCGIAMGIAQGAFKAVQAVNVDVQFLKASGVGVLSILNMSVFANVVKWGGNCALFASAFSVGDWVATVVKHSLLPSHDARRRSTSNYAVGLAASGATVGILPWWILCDVSYALRMSASGAFVGGLLGVTVGTVIERLVALNTARLDATKRELRRYEAVMQRQRDWVEEERERLRSQRHIWW